MAISRKHSKNLAKVQSMLDGDYNNKIQVGYGDTAAPTRKVGDVWTDAEGYEWEQKEGFKVKKSVMPAVGMFPHQCKDCGTNCDNKKRDKKTYMGFDRCFACQINFEVNLKAKKIGKKNCKWHFWVRLQQLYTMDAIEKDIEAAIFDNYEMDKSFGDMSVANAMANANIDTQGEADLRKIINKT